MISSFFTPFASSFLLAAASEFGDKTQLLSASLNLRFGRPWQILGAATLASAANHLIVASFGALFGRWIGFHLNPTILDFAVTCLFLILALFTLLAPGAQNGAEAHDANRQDKHKAYSFFGVFFVLLLVEMGDKTQIVTAALAAKYNSTFAVALGSSLGTILPDAAAIFLTQRLGTFLQWKHLRLISAGAFLISAVFAGLKL